MMGNMIELIYIFMAMIFMFILGVIAGGIK